MQQGADRRYAWKEQHSFTYLLILSGTAYGCQVRGQSSWSHCAPRGLWGQRTLASGHSHPECREGGSLGQRDGRERRGWTRGGFRRLNLPGLRLMGSEGGGHGSAMGTPSPVWTARAWWGPLRWGVSSEKRGVKGVWRPGSSLDTHTRGGMGARERGTKQREGEALMGLLAAPKSYEPPCRWKLSSLHRMKPNTVPLLGGCLHPSHVPGSPPPTSLALRGSAVHANGLLPVSVCQGQGHSLD